jgi:hypothetical protein
MPPSRLRCSVGDVFGSWTVVRVADDEDRPFFIPPTPSQVGMRGTRAVECACSCGEVTKLVSQTMLVTGRSVRCARCSSRVKAEKTAANNAARAAVRAAARAASTETPSPEEWRAAKREKEAAERRAELEAIQEMEQRQAAERLRFAERTSRRRLLERRRNGL